MAGLLLPVIMSVFTVVIVVFTLVGSNSDNHSTIIDNMTCEEFEDSEYSTASHLTAATEKHDECVIIGLHQEIAELQKELQK